MAGTREKTRVVVDRVEALPPGSTRIIEVHGRSIGVIHDRGRYYALRNACPHHGAPLCRGPVSGLMLAGSGPHTYSYSDAEEDRIVRCPWHGYEFRLSDGTSVTDPERMRVKTYDVRVEDGEVVVYV